MDKEAAAMVFEDWTESHEQRFLDNVEAALKLFNSLAHIDNRVSALIAVYDMVAQCKRGTIPTPAAAITVPVPESPFPNAQICRIWHATAQNYIMNRGQLYRYMYNPPGIPGIPHVDPNQLHSLDTHFFFPFVLSTPL
jgi:hypothetical protein